MVANIENELDLEKKETTTEVLSNNTTHILGLSAVL
jgi:hypothetical protein